jgi:hypothetical protein
MQDVRVVYRTYVTALQSKRPVYEALTGSRGSSIVPSANAWLSVYFRLVTFL